MNECLALFVVRNNQPFRYYCIFIYCLTLKRCEPKTHVCYSYVVGDSQHPLVVHGPRGCGKTTLLARAAQCCHMWQPEALLIVRFVSISTQSHTTEQLVRSIVDQCSVLTHGHQSWAVHVSSYTISYIRHVHDVNKM
jgi:replication-associated recombination protein RarA